MIYTTIRKSLLFCTNEWLYNILHQFMQFILLLTANCFIVTFHVYSFTRFVTIFDKSYLRFESIWLKFVVWPASSVISEFFSHLLVKSFAIIHWSLLQIFFIALNPLSTFHMYLSCWHQNQMILIEEALFCCLSKYHVKYYLHQRWFSQSTCLHGHWRTWNRQPANL